VLLGGAVFSHTFAAPGRFDYYCQFHLTNRGTIVVE
jgi:plastocyanin